MKTAQQVAYEDMPLPASEFKSSDGTANEWLIALAFWFGSNYNTIKQSLKPDHLAIDEQTRAYNVKLGLHPVDTGG